LNHHAALRLYKKFTSMFAMFHGQRLLILSYVSLRLFAFLFSPLLSRFSVMAMRTYISTLLRSTPRAAAATFNVLTNESLSFIVPYASPSSFKRPINFRTPNFHRLCGNNQPKR